MSEVEKLKWRVARTGNRTSPLDRAHDPAAVLYLSQEISWSVLSGHKDGPSANKFLMATVQSISYPGVLESYRLLQGGLSSEASGGRTAQVAANLKKQVFANR